MRAKEHGMCDGKERQARNKWRLRPDGHGVRVLLDIVHKLLAPDASFDENESALAVLEASVKYLGINITWVK